MATICAIFRSHPCRSGFADPVTVRVVKMERLVPCSPTGLCRLARRCGAPARHREVRIIPRHAPPLRGVAVLTPSCGPGLLSRDRNRLRALREILMRVRASSPLHPSLTPLWTGQPLAYPAVQTGAAAANHRFLSCSVSSVYGRGSSSSSSTWSGSERTLDVMRWGLVPFWAKDIKVGFANINGKAEGTRRPRPWEATQARTLRVPAGRDLWTADRARRSAVRRRPPHLERPHRPSGRRYGRKIGKCKAVDQ